jgi:hypothetical protein
MLVLLHQRDETVLAGRPQIPGHVLVGGENRRRGAELGAHIGDRCLAGGADRACTGPDIFDDCVGGAGDGQLPGDIEDDVLGRGPPAHAGGEVNRNVLRVEYLPRQSGDDLDGVGAAHSDGTGAETAGVRRVRVGADDQLAGEGVLLQHHLVDDAGAGSPKAQTVFRRRGTQKVIDFLVLGEGLAQIRGALDPRLDQVVAMDRRRHRDLVPPGLHELKQPGLPQHILEDDAIGTDEQIALAGLQLLVFGIVEMAEQDLVGQRQRPPQPAPDNRKVPRHRRVDRSRHFRCRFDSHHRRAFLAFCSGQQPPPRPRL